MIDFKTAKAEDKQKAKAYIEASKQMGADANFANMYLWGVKDGPYDTRIAFDGDFLYRGFFKNDVLSHYYLPLGGADINKALDVITQDAEERDVPLKFHLLTQSDCEDFDEYFKGAFEFVPTPEKFDYIYKQEDLAELSGRKYHSKRNHIAKFNAAYSEYCFKKITADNKNDAYYIAMEWCKNQSGGECSKSDPEICAINRAFKHFDTLELFGGILYVEGKPSAMTVGSFINSGVVDVHFEKTLPGMEFCYAVINNEFAKTMPQGVLVNREEDLGIEGLRKAKQSYKPEIVLEKFTAVLK